MNVGLYTNSQNILYSHKTKPFNFGKIMTNGNLFRKSYNDLQQRLDKVYSTP